MLVFEGFVVGFIVFAAGYVLLMKLMVRRADVLHGEFIQSDLPQEPVRAAGVLAVMQRYWNRAGLFARR